MGEMNNEVNVRRAKAHWKIRGTRERGDAHYDQTSEQHIVNRDAVRQDLWNKHVWEEAGWREKEKKPCLVFLTMC